MISSHVETLRKPSTGLKQVVTVKRLETGLRRRGDTPRLTVETLRKPSTGLKHISVCVITASGAGRDTQKTQHGIETTT